MDRRSRPVSHISSSRSRSSSRTSYSDIVAPEREARERQYSCPWHEIQVYEVIKDHKPIFCDKDTSIEEAASILNEHDLTQIPIRSSPDDARLVRTFDYSDLCAFLMMILDVDRDYPEDFQDTIRAARAGTAVPVYKISDLGFKDAFTTVQQTEQLGLVAKMLGTGLARVGVVDAQDNVIGVVSARVLLTFIFDNLSSFDSLRKLHANTVQDLNLDTAEPVSIAADERVIEAFQTMNRRSISSLAVVDRQHRHLLGNISLVDLKYVTRSSSIPILKTSIGNFLQHIKFEEGLARGRDSAPTFSCTMASTLDYVVAKLVVTKTHRLWVVEDDANRLSGVVSIADILKAYAASVGDSQQQSACADV
ncbi:cell separation during budding [Savitreella phatthalungensis]